MLTRSRRFDLPTILLAIILIIFLSTHSPFIEYDIDPSYITMGTSRPPLYPIFLALFRWAGSYQFNVVMWLQGIFTFASLLYVRHWLRTHLFISEFLIFLICAIVTLTILLHFQVWYIQSEGLAFPLFILTFFKLTDCFFEFSYKKILYLAFLVSLLILTRLQFYFIYLTYPLLLVWYFWQRVSIKKIAAATIILITSITLTTLIDHGYHYYKHGVFSGGSYSGLMILVQALYLADDNAAHYFQDPAEKSIIQAMINQRNAQHLNQDNALVKTMKPSYLEHAYQAYSRNYLALQDIIDNVFNTSVESKFGSRPLSEANAIAIHIDKILIMHEFKKNMTFLVWKFVQCMGGITLFIFFLIILMTLPIRIIKEGIRFPQLSLVFVAMITLVTFLNAAIIALCNPDIAVYFCYSQFLFYCLAGFLVDRTFITLSPQQMKISSAFQ